MCRRQATTNAKQLIILTIKDTIMELRLHIMDIIMTIIATISITIIHIINSHLVIVNDNNTLQLWLRKQLKLNAKCELEDHIVNMVLSKRFQHFWHQMKAMIVMFVMIQLTIKKIILIKLYKRIELAYNTICNNIIDIPTKQ